MNINFLRLLMLSNYIKNRNYYKLSSKRNFSSLFEIDYYGNLNENSCYFDIYEYYKKFCNSDLRRIQIRLWKDSRNVRSGTKLNHNLKYWIGIISDIIQDREFKVKIISLPLHRRNKCHMLRKRQLVDAYVYSRLYAELSEMEDSVLLSMRKDYEIKILDKDVSPNFKKTWAFLIETIDDVILDRKNGYIS